MVFMAVKTAKALIKRKADGEKSRDWERRVITDRKLPSHGSTKATPAFAGENPATCERFYPGMGGALCLLLCGNLGNVVCRVPPLLHGFP